MHPNGMHTSNEESNSSKRNELERQMQETKSIREVCSIKKKILLLDREDILEEQKEVESRITDLKDQALNLVVELEQLDEALKEYDKYNI